MEVKSELERKVEAHKALHDVQKTLNAPKNRYNSFGKYKYRSCGDILEGVKLVLPDGATVVCVDRMVKIGKRYYMKAMVSFFYLGTSIVSCGYARESFIKKGMDDSQMTGTASSYARKYALGGLFAIDDTKDADALAKDDTEDADSQENSYNSYRKPQPAANQERAACPPKVELISPMQVNQIEKMCTQLNASHEQKSKWLASLNVKRFNDIPLEQGRLLIDKLKSRIDDRAKESQA